uniref:RNA helicase n=1 Tax=Sparus aurata TaxID=8175 RepID=A0A671XW09_SPAAU
MMASDNDDMYVSLIEGFRPRLRELIMVQQVLVHLHFIDNEQKERITKKVTNEGNQAAAELLIDAVIRKPHSPGWFRAFVVALEEAGCERAADYIQDKLPEPEVEAENDYFVNLVQLMYPRLMGMQTKEVLVHCLSQKLLTQADGEIIDATTANQGSRVGAGELLRRIVRGRDGWFSKFLDVLRETKHETLYSDLTGSSPDCYKQAPSLPAGDACNCGLLTRSDDYCLSEPLLSVTDGTDSGTAAKSPEKADIVLRDYQAEVARPALEGKNIIICLPTGSGKTRVAVYITKKHLDNRRAEGQSGKVVVLVNKIPLVEQHYVAEFLPFLKRAYKVERVSGDSPLKISFTEIVKNNDVIICTAQILENYLERSNKGEDEGVDLSDLTLIVIDECHHTQKGGVYNHIMLRYLKQKHKNRRLKKEEKETLPLPQILGLTASPGVGGATILMKAEEHILRICANLDASKIMTRSLGEFKKEQRKKVLKIEDRKEDPFGDVIKKIMNAIHAHAELSPTCDLGSQNYEQWVVQTERKAATEEDQKVRVCAEHLRQYNEGLNLSNTIRMCDSFSFLNKFYEEEMKKKTTPDDEEKIQITNTERFLFNLFKENKEELQELATKPDYENDSLSKLRANILQEFSTRQSARGIIFTKTRRSAIALSQWIQENSKFADIGVKASHVIGGGDQSVVKPMTSAKGRGRAEDSSYSLVEVKNSGVAEKEVVNEYRMTMMDKAIEKIRALEQEEYDKRIMEYQMQAIMENRVLAKKKKQKGMKNENPSSVKFSCRGCNEHACSGEDIEIIEDMHRVNLTPQELFIQRENTTLQERHLDYETNGYIACKKCGERWGSMMLYRGLECPCLHVKNFVVTLKGKKINKCTKWSELTVRFSAFDYADHASQVAESSDDEDE